MARKCDGCVWSKWLQRFQSEEAPRWLASPVRSRCSSHVTHCQEIYLFRCVLASLYEAMSVRLSVGRSVHHANVWTAKFDYSLTEIHPQPVLIEILGHFKTTWCINSTVRHDFVYPPHRYPVLARDARVHQASIGKLIKPKESRSSALSDLYHE